jgi:hypothetical protein
MHLDMRMGRVFDNPKIFILRQFLHLEHHFQVANGNQIIWTRRCILFDLLERQFVGAEKTFKKLCSGAYAIRYSRTTMKRRVVK